MKNNKKGFTLVELVIVVAVMAILVAVAIPTIASITGKAQESVDNTNARSIESVIKLAEADASNNGKTALGANDIDKAIEDAKLGIESGSFVYDSSNGTVVKGTSAAAGQFKITFDIKAADAKDVVKVEAGSGTTTE